MIIVHFRRVALLVPTGFRASLRRSKVLHRGESSLWDGHYLARYVMLCSHTLYYTIGTSWEMRKRQ
jgi:hypothetical protein